MNTPTTPVPAKKSRPPGRPGGDTTAQRERLIDAALNAFAHKGIAASSLRAIASAAGVTPALVNYYFGNKAKLLAAVVAERLLPALMGLSQSLRETGDDPAALIREFIQGMRRVVQAHPWLPPLWVREVLCEGGGLRELLMSHIAPLISRMLAERFAAAQRRGALNPDLEPRLLVVSLVGLTLFPYAAAPIWRGLFNAPELDDEALARHTLILLERGLESPHAP
ncbi:TetR/AcrR family transcriptional regulator [Pseudomonas sp. sp1636]|uniref:TetR/AcrR family transcriptional regulator n=1 Tax=Pseudomonas sp. sp1636 TaxID=3036707 RepID=UPI0025A4EB51|nr:TetR/AcrR family transcriptional regulator [Pseudomonas sp. sp1636]MDM8349150.1 TetR/AcrR family transcriptional regulator [Pseudomonas sp. sp1636]